MSDNLEFHYVVSYREGYGWGIAIDVEQAVMTDGTIYDWTQGNGWTFPLEGELSDLDLHHYRMLNSALNLLNEGAINA
jgi:hypothetical protein